MLELLVVLWSMFAVMVAAVVVAVGAITGWVPVTVAGTVAISLGIGPIMYLLHVAQKKQPTSAHRAAYFVETSRSPLVMGSHGAPTQTPQVGPDFLEFAPDGRAPKILFGEMVAIAVMMLFMVGGFLWWFPAGPDGGLLSQPVGRILLASGFLLLTSPYGLMLWSGWHVIRRGPAGIRLAGNELVVEDKACFRHPLRLQRSNVAGIGTSQLTRYLSGKREGATVGPVNKSPNVFIEFHTPTAFPEARGIWPTFRTLNSPPPRPRRAVKRLYCRLADPDDVDRLSDWISGQRKGQA